VGDDEVDLLVVDAVIVGTDTATRKTPKT
jgi:hypothetical protein